MSLALPVIAQKKQAVSMNWKVAAELPADKGKLHATGLAGPVTGISGDMFFVGGGANFPDSMPWTGGKKKYYDKMYAYSIRHDQLVPFKRSFTLPFPIAYSACCSTSFGLLYAGGENETGITNKVGLVQWDTKTKNITVKKLPDLPIAVTNAAITLVGNTVYLAGGETATGASSQFIALDLKNTGQGWKPLLSLPYAVSHTVAAASTLQHRNKIYIAGGRKKNNDGISDLFADVLQYDIASNSWEKKASLPYALSAGAGIITADGNLLLFGGDKGTTFHQVEIFIAAISNEKDDIKKQTLILEKNKLQAAHPGFSKEILLYDIKTDSWKTIGIIPFATPVTTTAVKNNEIIYIPSGEIRAGVRSPHILSVTILGNK